MLVLQIYLLLLSLIYFANAESDPSQWCDPAVFRIQNGLLSSATADDLKCDSVNFYQQEITEVDSSTFLKFPYLNNLDFSRNEIKEFKRGTFRNQGAVYSIKLDSNNITKLTNAYSDLTALTDFWAIGNLINSIDKNVFDTMVELNILGLDDNYLDHIPVGVFDTTWIDNNLQFLQINRNRIKELRKGSFSALRSLIFLQLADNEIESVHPEAFMGAVTLTKLNISGNQLREFPSKLVSNSHLSLIDLSRNPITVLPDLGNFKGALIMKGTRVLCCKSYESLKKVMENEGSIIECIADNGNIISTQKELLSLQGVCVGCPKSKVLYKGSCVACNEREMFFEDKATKSCLKCTPQPDCKTGASIEKCLPSGNELHCRNCETGELRFGKCIEVVLCKKNEIKLDGVCQKCTNEGGYYLDEEGSCKVCESQIGCYGTGNDAEECVPGTKFLKCNACNTQQNYVFIDNENKLCGKCDSDSTYYKSQCVRCKDLHYYGYGRVGDGQCQKCKIQRDCEEGFDGNECVPESLYLSCSKCRGHTVLLDSGFCGVCEPNEIRKENKCVACSDLPNYTSDSNGLCIKCKAPASEICPSHSVVASCVNNNPILQCLNCNQGYENVDGFCKDCNANEIFLKGKCVNCGSAEGYKLDSHGNCIRTEQSNADSSEGKNNGVRDGGNIKGGSASEDEDIHNNENKELSKTNLIIIIVSVVVGLILIISCIVIAVFCWKRRSNDKNKDLLNGMSPQAFVNEGQITLQSDEEYSRMQNVMNSKVSGGLQLLGETRYHEYEDVGENAINISEDGYLAFENSLSNSYQESLICDSYYVNPDSNDTYFTEEYVKDKDNNFKDDSYYTDDSNGSDDGVLNFGDGGSELF